MMGQTQVVVRPEHDPLLTLNDDNRVLGLGNRLEVRIQPGRLHFPRTRELPALLEQRDLLEGLSIHGTSARSEGCSDG